MGHVIRVSLKLVMTRGILIHVLHLHPHAHIFYQPVTPLALGKIEPIIAAGNEKNSKNN